MNPIAGKIGHGESSAPIPDSWDHGLVQYADTQRIHHVLQLLSTIINRGRNQENNKAYSALKPLLLLLKPYIANLKSFSSSSMTATKVAIIGAGIAGPVLAMLLRQKGYDPVLYERSESVTSAGLSLA